MAERPDDIQQWLRFLDADGNEISMAEARERQRSGEDVYVDAVGETGVGRGLLLTQLPEGYDNR